MDNKIMKHFIKSKTNKSQWFWTTSDHSITIHEFSGSMNQSTNHHTTTK